MKMKLCAAGISLLCLMMLSGCTTAPDLPPPTIIYAGCPRVSSCPIPESQPITNGALSEDVRQLERALVSCAQQVETVKHCQEELDAQAEKPAQSAE
ncbi:Rz1-like lysis system protein LysC [Serratia fonticola]|uniref:Rz1-like lysis system protein LysC n=1 Tax=Serratia fonticola TaxID=47917 RepID=UPI0021BD510D|nr:Rz1-like lysis system protein LysC [Serratia fonticola]